VRTLCFEKSLDKIAGMAVEFPTFPNGRPFPGRIGAQPTT
jgi:uncharacterized protein (DUF934 family)